MALTRRRRRCRSARTAAGRSGTRGRAASRRRPSAAGPPARSTRKPSAVVVTVDRGPRQQVERDLEVLGPAADDLDVTSGRRPRRRPRCRRRSGRGRRACSVGRRASTPSISIVDVPGAADLGAHRHEQLGDVDDLRLAGGVLERVCPRGQHRGHQDVLGGPDARELEADARRRRRPCGRRGDEVAVGDVDLGAQRLEALRVQVEPARADGVATGHRDVGLAARGRRGGRARRSRPAARGPARSRPGARCARGRRSRRRRSAASPVDVAAEPPQQLGHDRHVDDGRDVGQPGAAHGEQRAGHQLERAVLGARRRGPVPGGWRRRRPGTVPAPTNRSDRAAGPRRPADRSLARHAGGTLGPWSTSRGSTRAPATTAPRPSGTSAGRRRTTRAWPPTPTPTRRTPQIGVALAAGDLRRGGRPRR